MANKPVILLIEDEASIRNFITTVLAQQGYSVVAGQTGAEAPSLIASHCPNLILLDLGLPDIDGLTVLEKLRTWSQTPIVVITARGNEADKVKALDLGADDYVTKPFGTLELLARIRTALRHSRAINAELSLQASIYKAGGLLVDDEKRVVSVDGIPVRLTPIEYKILLLLAQNAGRVLTLDSICHKVWGPYTDETNALRVNMANIRRKIERNPAEPRYILTEIGVGYRLAQDG